MPHFTGDNGPNRRLSIALRLGLLTSIKLVNFPGIKGSALISIMDRTGPGVTGCRFAALAPILNIIEVSRNSSFIVTSVPNLVRNTNRNVNLNRRFLHRIREYELLLRILSISNDRNHSPVSSFRGVGRRLSIFDRRLALTPRVVINGGYSLVSRSRMRHLGTCFRSEKCGFFPVVTTVTRNAARLVGCITDRLTGLPPVGVCRTRRGPRVRVGGSHEDFAVHGSGNICCIRGYS